MNRELASSLHRSHDTGQRPLVWVDGWTFIYNTIGLTFHRTGNTGPATELGFSPAKGLYRIYKRQ